MEQEIKLLFLFKSVSDLAPAKFPSISATSENNDARVTITHPISIRGTKEERTATIQVVAECDTVVFDYSVIFDFARSVQTNEMEPFRER